MVNKQIEVKDKFDEDDKQCKNCIHKFWDEFCNDFGCNQALYCDADGICRYEPRED